jgi:hypothetical protein
VRPTARWRGAPVRSLSAVLGGRLRGAGGRASSRRGNAVIDQTVVLARATPEGEAEYLALVSQLRLIWSDLEPIPRQPSLASREVQSGVWIVGRRDYHADTGTYLTYRVFRQVWIPLLFLGAYRVWEGPTGNLVFVGRHPLPLWARSWNVIGGVLVAFMVYVGIQALRDIMR